MSHTPETLDNLVTFETITEHVYRAIEIEVGVAAEFKPETEAELDKAFGLIAKALGLPEDQPASYLPAGYLG
jgi:hypothetical protein